MSNKSFYISNLNGLRFLAAFAVILGHTELTKKSLGLSNLLDSNLGFFNSGGGHQGVVLFFVLSGFLITILLIKEKERYKTINFKKFIIRRALRIWPVYFLFVSTIIFAFHGIGSLLEEKTNGGLLIGMYLLILPNLAMSGFGSIKHIAHLWSIGVEEQFYLIWPFILKYFSRRKIILIMCFLVVVIPIIPHFADFLAVRFPGYTWFLKIIRLFFQYFLINSMAIGGLLAFIYTKYGLLIKKRINFLVSSVIIGLCIILWARGVHFSGINDVVYPFIFGVFILVVSLSPPLLLFENKIVSYLGKISYGLYVYHWVVIYLFFSFLKENEIELGYFLSLSVSFIITVLISSLSYELLEKNILKFKVKYALIKSGKI